MVRCEVYGFEFFAVLRLLLKTVDFLARQLFSLYSDQEPDRWFMHSA